jgi:hypothetical protein
MPDWDFIFDDSVPFGVRLQKVFNYQIANNPVYRTFYTTVTSGRADPDNYKQIPKIPIRAFREAKVASFHVTEAELFFKSSGTGDMNRSTHYLKSSLLYRESIKKGFDCFYDPEKYVIWCYTPAYQDNPDSSLIYMLKQLVTRDSSGLSRFLKLDRGLDSDEIEEVSNSGKKLMIFGAAFGLLDLLQLNRIILPEDSVIVETGGMKTYKREMGKTELHQTLAEGFGLSENQVHSEYGMCELLSQAYAKEKGWFETPHWMMVTVHDPLEPMRLCKPGEEGNIGVIDLANFYSCSFILTDDRGVMDKKGRFRVLGRWNSADLRGCNFLIDRDM